MGFIKKVWKNRISEYPTRRTLTKEDGSTELVTVSRSEGTVSQEGDAFSAENMNNLEKRIQDAIGTGEIPEALGTDIIGALSVLNSNLSVRYDENSDSVQIYYNGVWKKWLSVGFNAFNILATQNSDWYVTSDSSSNSGRSVSISENNAIFNVGSGGGSGTDWSYFRTTFTTDLTNFSYLKFKAIVAFSGTFLNFGINIVDAKTLTRTTIYKQQLGNTGSGGADNVIDISGYSGEYYIEVFSNWFSTTNTITVSELYTYN